VVATDITDHRPVLFSRKTTPDVRVAEAVRASMSIPGYFAARRWRGHVLVDGALVPSGLWDLYDGYADAKTIFILLAAPPSPTTGRRKRHLWIWDYVFRVVRMLILAMENGRVPAHLWNETVLIRTGSVSAVDFALTPAQKAALVEEGYHQVKTHLTAKSDLFAKERAGVG